MRWHHLVLATFFLVAWPTLAAAQRTSERMEGLQRVCSYPGMSNVTNAQVGVREYRVGLGQNCPSTMPLNVSAMPAPPTARLVSEELVGQIRTCVYEQTGTMWVRSIPGGRPCPPSPGMIAESDSHAPQP